jgi:catechol 2,3-dioxygenase-like lactoylglutathione lyase family enzyme
MRIDHIGLDVADFRDEQGVLRAGAGAARDEGPDGAGARDLRLRRRLPLLLEQTGVHVAFTAKDRPMVDAFHAAALAAGGADNGGPGVREIYHPHYYGAFALDPDGNNVEAVCHKPD